MTDDLVTVTLEQALRERLAPALRRARRLRILEAWAACAAIAALAGVALAVLEDRRGMDVRLAWALLAAGIAAALVITRRRIVATAPDLRALAARIERAQPELRALLLTAVAQASASPDGAPGYLQQQVIRDAIDQAAPERWARAVPSWRARAAAAGMALASGALLLAACWSLLPSLSLFPDEYGLSVSPGDTETERGTGVLVLARFARKVPSGVALLLRVPGRAPARIEMSRNLEDPVWGALTPAVDADRVEYAVEYDGRRSARFRIRAFDRPELERLDAQVSYPRQAKIAPVEHKDVRVLKVVEGARIALTAHLQAPASEAKLEPEEGAARVLRRADSDGRRFTITIDPDRTRRYELRLADERGRLGRGAARLVIEVHRDLPPRIALTFPGRDRRVSPLEELAIEAKIADDVGVHAWGVSFGAAGRPPQEARLGTGTPAPREQTLAHLVRLEDLGLEPGTLLSYHVWAEDLTSDGKPRRVSSDLTFAEVRPFEELFREGASQGDPGAASGAAAGGPNRALAREQKEIVNATWKLERQRLESPEPVDLKADVEVVRMAQGAVREKAEEAREQVRGGQARAALDEAIEAMQNAYDLLPTSLAQALEREQAALAALTRGQPRERQVVRGRSRRAGGGDSEGNDDLDSLELRQQDSRYETRREASDDNEADRADRRALGRLRELAQRQKALTDRLRELQAALQKAKPEERDELQRRLKRLRDEQQELLSEVDDLRRQADPSATQRSRLGEVRQQLEQARAQAQEAAEALARGETARGVGASTRAERGLAQAHDELRQRVSNALAEELRRMRSEARRLAQEQRQIAEALAAGGADAGTGRAVGGTEARRLAEATRQQQRALGGLLERMQRTTEDAEAPSPLLARKLYDSLRKASTDGIDRALSLSGEALDRNLSPQAAGPAEQAARGLAALEEGVRDAAKGVIGDEAQALRLARNELESLVREAQTGQREGTQAEGAGEPQPDRNGQAQAGGGEGSGQPGARPQEGRGQTPGEGARQATEGRAQGAGSGERGGGTSAQGVGGGPIAGDGFRAWSERLRDVEELLDDPQLRSSAGGIRDRARTLRAEARRHGRPPTTEALEGQVLGPLAELRDRVSEELRRIDQGKDKLAPIDRDPVPARFSDVVRRYWRSLAGEEPAPAREKKAP